MLLCSAGFPFSRWGGLSVIARGMLQGCKSSIIRAMSVAVKVRRDLVFVLKCALYHRVRVGDANILGRRTNLASTPCPKRQICQRRASFLAPVGFASLAIILIGLIVAWTGYLNKIRWAWLVMFVIVWMWAFPTMILPILQMRKGISLTEWFHTAIREPRTDCYWR